MRKGAILDLHFIYLGTALLATQAGLHQSGKKGFRQKDVKFFIELFSNWMSSSLRSHSLWIHNVQIQRFLDQLSEQAWLKKNLKHAQPEYVLTKAGLLSILKKLIDLDYIGKLHNLLFIFHILENYGPRIEKLVEQTPSEFPLTYQVDLRDLLNLSTFIKTQIQLLDKEIEKLQLRIKESLEMAKLSKELFKKNVPNKDITALIQRKYPYELNSQKPFSELMKEIPQDIFQWELESMSEIRAIKLWTPIMQQFEYDKKVLMSLKYSS